MIYHTSFPLLTGKPPKAVATNASYDHRASMTDRALQLGRFVSLLPSQHFAFSAIAAISSKIAAACLTFVLGVILARILGYSAYGEYAFILAIVQFIAIISKCGLDNTALRYAAQYRASNNHRMLRNFLGDTARVNLTVSCGIAVIVAGAAWLFSSQMPEGFLACFLWGAMLLAIMPVVQVREATLVALGKVSQGIVGPVIVPAVFIVLMLMFNTFSPFSSSSSSTMFLHVVAALTGLLIASVFLSQCVNNFSSGGHQQTESRYEWRPMAFSMMMVNIMIYIQGQSGTFFSGVLLGTEQSGLFSVATRISGASLLGLSSINMIAAPRMATLYASGDKRGLQRIAKLCIWGSLALSLPIVLLTALYGKSLLQYFGAEFIEAYSALLVLLIGLIINASTGSAAHLLYMTGHHATCLRLYAIVAALTVLLHFCLIPKYGIWGAALTTMIVQAIWNLALVYHVKKKIGIWSFFGLSTSIPT